MPSLLTPPARPLLAPARTRSAALGDIATQLQAYWRLDETIGPRYDAWGSNHLTDNNSVGVAAGKTGGAATFDNLAAQHLSLADNTALSVGDVTFTFTGWLWVDGISDNCYLSKWSDTSSEYLLDISSSDNILRWLVRKADNSGNVAVQATTFGAITSGVWYFIHCYHDAALDEIGISLNNGTADTAALAGGVRDGTAPFQLGFLTAGAPRYWKGRADGVGRWNRRLTAAELSALYNGGNGPGLGQEVA